MIGPGNVRQSLEVKKADSGQDDAIAALRVEIETLETETETLRTTIETLENAVDRKGYTIVPLEMYWKKSNAKLKIGLAKGKQDHDKRDTEKDRDWQREKSRVMKHSHR